jgi:soluble lytic murein transglycosylase
MRLKALLLATMMIGAPAVAQQQDDPLAPIEDDGDQQASPVATPVPAPAATPTPAPPPRPIVVPTDWRGVFAAIRAQDWGSAQAGIAALPDHPLKPVARAELYTARNSPLVDVNLLQGLLAEAPDLPQAPQLVRLAQTRGATFLPSIPGQWRMIPLGSAPRRQRARPVAGEPAADGFRLAVEPFVEANSAPEAEALFQQALPTLSFEARAEAAQRVAWIYYIVNRDADARRVAELGLPGATGEWATHTNWIAGLASWRMNDCNASVRHFRAVASGQGESELRAAGAYWAARSEMACRRPQNVAPLLKAAARSPESFYGLIARETLGMDTRLPPLSAQTSPQVEALPNVQRALRLADIGEYRLAEEHLRHQARIGRPSDHGALIAITRRVSFAGAQYWLAHNGPSGASVQAAGRYPLPQWTPTGGWRIDPALAFAHARQESDFRPAAVSPAGAVGLMQVRPGTAGDFARGRGTSVGDLTNPSVNLEYGQSFIELMRRSPYTQGQLLKIMAAYNAGPVPVSRWNYINDRGDPLLWIESLSYWETRYYVPTVLRNFWVYQGLQGATQSSLKAMAQHRWPEFPVARR